MIWDAITLITVTSHYYRGVPNHQPLNYLFSDLFMATSKEASQALLREIPPATGGTPSQRVSNSESVSTWWRHRGIVTDTARCLRRRKRRRQLYGNESGKSSWTLSSRRIISSSEDTKQSLARESKSSLGWRKTHESWLIRYRPNPVRLNSQNFTKNHHICKATDKLKSHWVYLSTNPIHWFSKGHQVFVYCIMLTSF